MKNSFCVGNCGFTLIEFTIIILVISIIALSIVPRMVSKFQISAELAADVAASDIRAVQNTAMFAGSPLTITFSGASYTTQGLNPESRTLPGEASAQAHSITFNSFGEPESGDGSFDITCNGYVKTLTISPLTGKVTIN